MYRAPPWPSPRARRSAETWILRLLSSTKMFDQTLAINSSLGTTRPAFSVRTVRMPTAGLQSRTGLSPSSSSRWLGRRRNEPNAKPRSPFDAGRGSFAAGIVHLVEQPLRGNQIGGGEALDKLVVDRPQQRQGIRRPGLIVPQPCEARGGAQFPGQRLLLACRIQRLAKKALRHFIIFRIASPEGELAIDTEQLGCEPAWLGLFDRSFEHCEPLGYSPGVG